MKEGENENNVNLDIKKLNNYTSSFTEIHSNETITARKQFDLDGGGGGEFIGSDHLHRPETFNQTENIEFYANDLTDLDQISSNEIKG